MPDLIIEILSPSNAAYDPEVKLAAYARAGLPEYAIVNAEACALIHYQLAEPGALRGAAQLPGGREHELRLPAHYHHPGRSPLCRHAGYDPLKRTESGWT